MAGTEEYDQPRQLNVTNINCSTAMTPFPVMSMKPFAPFYTVRRSEPFVAKNAWKSAIHGIKALKRLKLNIGKKEKLRSELTVVSGHTHGHMMVWNGDNFALKGSATHYNNVSVTNVVVTNTMIYSTVEKDSMHGGKAGDDCDVYVWDLNTMELIKLLSGHEDRVTAIVVDEANECRVVTGSVDKTILVWDTKQGGDTPQMRLIGHATSVSKLLLFETTLYSAGSDGSIRIWDLLTGNVVSNVEGHQASISFMSWVHQPSIEVPQGAFLTACSSGTVKWWQLDSAKEMTNLWTNKAHKALTTDVCCDGHIIVSSSTTDGINFFNSDTKKNDKFGFGDTGVRNLAIDCTRKLVVCGTDSGVLTLLSYEGLVTPQIQGITVFAQLQPHIGSITSILLERSQNGQWERIVTASNDHSLFTLDFDVSRDSKSYSGFVSRSICQIAQTGTVVTPCENSGLLWDPTEMFKKTGMQKSLEGHTKKVTCSRYSEEFSKVITGSEDGFIRTYDVLFFSEADMKNEEMVESCDATNLGMNVRCLSKPKNFIVAVGLQKFGTQIHSKAGGIAIVSITRGTAIGQIVPTFLFPVAIELHTWEAGTENILHFTVVAQLRNGELITFNGTEDGVFTNTRTVMREQVPYTPERELEGSVPMPVAVKSRMNTKYNPPRIELLAVEGANTFRSFDVAPVDGNSTTFVSVQMSSDIMDFQPLLQGDCYVAFALENSDTAIINAKGETVYSIGYDGSVIDHQQEEIRPARRRRTFVKTDGNVSYSHTRQPAASVVAVSTEHRYVAIGYRDGLIQIYDVPAKRVCRRIHAHVTAVAKILPLSMGNRFVSMSIAGTLRFDTIYTRNVRERESTPPPERNDHQKPQADGGAQRVAIAAHPSY